MQNESRAERGTHKRHTGFPSVNDLALLQPRSLSFPSDAARARGKEIGRTGKKERKAKGRGEYEEARGRGGK